MVKQVVLKRPHGGIKRPAQRPAQRTNPKARGLSTAAGVGISTAVGRGTSTAIGVGRRPARRPAQRPNPEARGLSTAAEVGISPAVGGGTSTAVGVGNAAGDVPARCRFSFHGVRATVLRTDMKAALAVAAQARMERSHWTQNGWAEAFSYAIKPFRAKKGGRRDAMVPAAVGASPAAAEVKQGSCTPGGAPAADQHAAAAPAEQQAAAAGPARTPRKDCPAWQSPTFKMAVADLKNALDIQPPFTYVGLGSTGRVYRCLAAVTRPLAAKPAVGGLQPVQPVAVKVVPKHTFPASTKALWDGAMDVCIRREIDNGAALQGHPNIVRLLSWTDTHFDTQLIFPFYPESLWSGMLEGMFKKPKPGKVDLLQMAAKQTLSGLSHMHSLLILHRDLKADNILVSPVKPAAWTPETAAVGAISVQCVIADLGSSALLAVGSHTEGGDTPLGTYQYRAPETICLRPCWDRESDVWAAGIVVLAVHLERVPFGRDRVRHNEIMSIWYEIMQTMTTFKPPRSWATAPPSHKNRGEWYDLMDGATQKKPHELPWGERGSQFRVFTHEILTVSKFRRPSCDTLLRSSVWLNHKIG